jgi:hypothetical protein
MQGLLEEHAGEKFDAKKMVMIKILVIIKILQI